MKTLIKNGLVITMDEKRLTPYEYLDIVIENDKIYYIGDCYQEDYDNKIDATGKIILPGLINAHTHLGMSLFRSSNDQLPLMDWLTKKIWPKEAQMTDDDIYYTTLVSALEMIKTGTTCANDMYFGWLGGIKALEQAKLRCVYSRFLIGTGDESSLEKMTDFENMLEKNQHRDLLTFSVSPHGLYTCSKEYLMTCEDLATMYQLPLHLHFCENQEELKIIEDTFHQSPVQVLEELGFLNHRLILAHGTFISKEDQQRLIGKNVSIITNPVSNLNLGCGIADITSYLRHGINVCLGTDGQGSGNNLNLFKHMAFACDLQKALYQDPTVISSLDVLKMATINGAKALGLSDKIGSLEKGKQADLIILDLNNIELTPTIDVLAQVVHNVESSNVDTTIINGEILMQQHQLTHNIDEELLKEKLRQISERLQLS